MTLEKFFQEMKKEEWIVSDVVCNNWMSISKRGIHLAYCTQDGTINISTSQTVVDVPLKVVDTKITGLNLKDLVSIVYYPNHIVFDFEGDIKISIPVKY